MSGMMARLIPTIMSAMGNSGGASSGAASQGASALSDAKDEVNIMKQIGEAFEREIGRHQYSTLLDPAYLGQQNASGSNAPLDKALGSDARKVAGASEGGATPQLQNNVKQDLVGVARKPTEEQLKIAKASPWYRRGRDMMAMLFNG